MPGQARQVHKQLRKELGQSALSLGLLAHPKEKAGCWPLESNAVQ